MAEEGVSDRVSEDTPDPQVVAGASLHRDRRPALARALGVVALLAIAGGLFLVWLDRSNQKAGDLAIVGVFILSMLAFVAVGVVMASRLPDNAVAWGFLAIPLGVLITVNASEYAVHALQVDPGSWPGARWAAWVAAWAFVPYISCIPLLVVLFPDGRVPGPRWRPLPWAIVALTALATVATALLPGRIQVNAGIFVRNPVGVGDAATWHTIQQIGGIGIFVGLLLSIAGMIVRYRRARGDERQQLRWFAYACGLALSMFILAFLTAPPNGQSTVVGDLVFFLFIVSLGIGIPAASAVAILRYRLYDLDQVVKKTVIGATVAVLLTALFVLVAVIVGGLAGRSQTGAVIAAGAIGLAFWPAVRVSRLIADRIVYGRRATPYELLTEFSGRMAETYSTEDVLPRMAAALAQGTGAASVVIWLRVGGEFRPVGCWPEAAPAAVPAPGEELPAFDDPVTEVRHHGELLGAITVRMPANDPMTSSKERLIADLAAQAGLVLRNVRLVEELRGSRRRLVAAQDDERRKIERNIHDGAQQQLVALSVQLRLVEQLVRKDVEQAASMLIHLQSAATSALEDLRDLARGIYPPLLADKGLAAALETQARRAAVPTSLETDGVGRYHQDVESAVYFCALEAMNNVAKYANASHATILLAARAGALTFSVIDDGSGFDAAAAGHGTGIQGMADRLDAIGGELLIESTPGSGTRVIGRVPVDTGA